MPVGGDGDRGGDANVKTNSITEENGNNLETPTNADNTEAIGALIFILLNVFIVYRIFSKKKNKDKELK